MNLMIFGMAPICSYFFLVHNWFMLHTISMVNFEGSYSVCQIELIWLHKKMMLQEKHRNYFPSALRCKLYLIF
uniref:Uncharacterized protein n=1 Tax=Rhizophora mucronata TaxID=61149 RepID=A0A2P2Q9H5_RHIMU